MVVSYSCFKLKFSDHHVSIKWMPVCYQTSSSSPGYPPLLCHPHCPILRLPGCGLRLGTSPMKWLSLWGTGDGGGEWERKSLKREVELVGATSLGLVQVSKAETSQESKRVSRWKRLHVNRAAACLCLLVTSLLRAGPSLLAELNMPCDNKTWHRRDPFFVGHSYKMGFKVKRVCF